MTNSTQTIAALSQRIAARCMYRGGPIDEAAAFIQEKVAAELQPYAEVLDAAEALVESCTPSGIPGEKGYGVKMPDRATVDRLRAALTKLRAGKEGER